MKFISILIKEGRKEDLKKKYANKFDEETLDWILNIADLQDFNHKYTDFVLKHVNPGYVDGDVEIGVDLIKSFDKYQSQLEKKDINQYSGFEELDNVLVPIQQKQKEKELEKQVDKIYEDDTFLVVKPKTHQASCKYGSNTKWCTTAQSDTHFKQYTRDNQGLYYIINKKNSTNQNYSKIAIHFDNSGSKRYWDSKDSPMSDREIAVVDYAFPEMISAIDDDYSKHSQSKLDIFLKNVFNSPGVSTKTDRKYLNTDSILQVNTEGFETINDLGPGHAQGNLSINLNGTLIDEYSVFITYKPIDSKSFRASIGFMGKDPDNQENFIDLDLEGWGFDSKYLITNTSEFIADSIRNHITSRVGQHIQNNPKLEKKVIGDKKVFRPTYGYTFGKNKGWVKKLVDYLDAGKIGTKLDFLQDINYLEKVSKDGKAMFRKTKGQHLYTPRQLRGQHSSFFAAAKNAGILGYRKIGKDFFLIKGPNFDAFKKGELKAL